MWNTCIVAFYKFSCFSSMSDKAWFGSWMSLLFILRIIPWYKSCHWTHHCNVAFPLSKGIVAAWWVRYSTQSKEPLLLWLIVWIAGRGRSYRISDTGDSRVKPNSDLSRVLVKSTLEKPPGRQRPTWGGRLAAVFWGSGAVGTVAQRWTEKQNINGQPPGYKPC